MIETIESLKEHREYLFTVIDGLVDDNEIYAQRNISLAQERDRLRDEIEIIKHEHEVHCAEAYNNAVRQITAIKEKNAKLREALIQIRNLHALDNEGAGSFISGIIELEEIASNALKEVG